MEKKKSKKEFKAGKSIGILFLYLFIWWILLTLVSVAMDLNDTDSLYYILNFLRISVPILVVIFGVPVILIIDSNKKNGSKM